MNNRIIMSGILLLITIVSSAMEQQLATLSKSSSEQNPGLLSFVYGSFTSTYDSVSSTVSNGLFDSSAFRKLGWPPSDENAQQELEKSKAIYKRVNDSIQNQKTYPTFLEDCTAITRRNAICQRVLVALDSYPDALNLALFCMQHHRQTLNEFDFLRFLAFVNTERSKSTQSAQEVCKELTKIMVFPNNNALLNNFVKQSIPNVSDQEIEEPKKSDEKKEAKKNGKK